MSKLSPDLAAHLHHWRERMRSSEAVVDERITVNVTFEGSLDPLREAGLEAGATNAGLVSGLIPLSRLDDLEALPSVIYIEKQPEPRPLLDGSVEEIRVPWKLDPATPNRRGAGVIVAVIDSGIDIGHESFLDSGNTRILEVWDQGATQGGTAPAAPYAVIGRIYNRAQIDAMLTLRQQEVASDTDESSLTPFNTIDTNGHGTHVAGIAAGNGRQDDRCSSPNSYSGVAPHADIIAVKTIGVTNSNMSDAIQWCVDAATRHNRPVVINMSLGLGETGPHDPTDFFARYIDGLLVNAVGGPPPGVAIVCSAGNEGNDNAHDMGQAAANGTVTLPFTIYNQSKKHRDKVTRTNNPITDTVTLDFWYDSAATFSVSLTAPPNPNQPGPNTIGPFAPGVNPAATIGGMQISITSWTNPIGVYGNRKRITLNISANANLLVRSGAWSIQFTETSGNPANWHIWTDAAGPWSPSFKQSGDSAAVLARRRSWTVGSPSCAPSAITVANYADTDELNESSSWGAFPIPATTAVGDVKPTIAAPGTSIAAPYSETTTGRSRNSSCCDQKVVDLTGTSMAAPHVAGLVALMFEINPTMTFADVRSILMQGSTTDDLPTSQVPSVYPNGANPLNLRAGHQWGAGRIDATATLANVVAPIGGGGGGGPTISVDFPELELGEHWGYTPHTIFSRLAEIERHIGRRPGLGLAAALISNHVDETLYLINNNPRVGAVWQRNGGPNLVRSLLHWRVIDNSLMPLEVEEFSVSRLFDRFLAILDRFAGPQLRGDIARFGSFAKQLPGSSWDALDRAALDLERRG